MANDWLTRNVNKRGRPLVRQPGRKCSVSSCTQPAASNGLASLCMKHNTDQRRYGSVRAVRVSTRTITPYAEVTLQLLRPHQTNEVVLACLSYVKDALLGDGLPRSAHTYSHFIRQHNIIEGEPLRFLAGWIGCQYWCINVSEDGLGDQKAELYQTLTQATRFMHGSAHYQHLTRSGNSFESQLFPPRGGTLYTARWLAPRLAPLVTNAERSITARLQSDLPPEVKIQRNMKAFSDALRLEAEEQKDLPLPKQRGKRIAGPKEKS